MKTLDIVIIEDFCGSLDEKGNNRFLYLSELLSKKHNVELVTSNFCHGTKQKHKEIHQYCSVKVSLLDEPVYLKNISLKRFYAHYKWGLNVKKYLQKRKKPDVVYCGIPTLKAANSARKYCQKNGIRFVIDIQDLWPEAFGMVFRIPVISSLIFAPFKLLANRIYKSADAICAVSETYVNRALSVNKKCKSGTAVFLGTELATFDKNAKENEAPEKGKDEIWLAYCGSMGDSYDLGCVIDALALLDNPPKFVAIGTGQKKDEFEKYAKEKDVNCLFTGKLPYEQMCAYLCACDITVNPIVGNSAASIINKHADYAASGLPVINTQESDEYRRLVDEYKMGFNCRNGDASDLAEKIKILIDDADLRERMGKNARRCAEEKFDRANTYSALADIICKQNGA